jgi:biotin transport system substrate-specific component
MLATGWPLGEAVEKGVVPFLLGDLIKAAAAGLLLPGAWKLLGDR